MLWCCLKDYLIEPWKQFRFTSLCFLLLQPLSTLRPSLVLLLSLASWDQSRTGQDSYVLMASSQAEMEEWVKFLKRVAGTPSGGKDPSRLSWVVSVTSLGWGGSSSRYDLSLNSIQRPEDNSEAMLIVKPVASCPR